MRKLFLFFRTSVLFCLISVLICSCSEKPGCQIAGVCKDEVYTSVKFLRLDGSLISTAQISGSDFDFSVDENVVTPYLSEILLINPSDSTDYVTIPVGIENGKVKISFGSSFKIAGTPLNDKIQVFLSGLSQLHDNLTSPDRTVEVSAIADEFSHYYCKSITLNYDNPLGEYIYSRYGSHLNDADRALAEQSLKK